MAKTVEEKIRSRTEFYNLNKERLDELRERCKQKKIAEKKDFAVVCIDVDDPVWKFLVDMLMPNHDWTQYRQQGLTPVARGVIPRDMAEKLIELVPEVHQTFPKGVPNDIPILVCSEGGMALCGNLVVE